MKLSWEQGILKNKRWHVSSEIENKGFLEYVVGVYAEALCLSEDAAIIHRRVFVITAITYIIPLIIIRELGHVGKFARETWPDLEILNFSFATFWQHFHRCVALSDVPPDTQKMLQYLSTHVSHQFLLYLSIVVHCIQLWLRVSIVMLSTDHFREPV